MRKYGTSVNTVNSGIIFTIPVLYLLLIIAAVLPPGFWVLLGIMLLFSWVGFVGVVRADAVRVGVCVRLRSPGYRGHVHRDPPEGPGRAHGRRPAPPRAVA